MSFFLKTFLEARTQTPATLPAHTFEHAQVQSHSWRPAGVHSRPFAVITEVSARPLNLILEGTALPISQQGSGDKEMLHMTLSGALIFCTEHTGAEQTSHFEKYFFKKRKLCLFTLLNSDTETRVIKLTCSNSIGCIVKRSYLLIIYSPDIHTPIITLMSIKVFFFSQLLLNHLKI